MAPAAWNPSSWREKPITQDVAYEDKAHFEKVLGKLRKLPPLVSPVEIDRLRAQLADVSAGKAFLLQGGDCAELFDDCSQDPIEHKLSLILLMSLIILHGSRLPVVRIARIAGQYAKPRSKPTEVVELPVKGGKEGETEKKEVLSFRGDNVNGYEPDDRAADPDRLLGAYFHSTATLNYIRTLLSSGFANLDNPVDWSFSHVRSPELQSAFGNVIESLQDSLEFMKVASGGSISGGGGERGGTETVEVYTSHEALLLEYEEALTRSWGAPQAAPSSQPDTPILSRSASRIRDSSTSSYPHSPVRRARSPKLSESFHGMSMSASDLREVEVDGGKKWYNTSAHFIWIGDRTRQLDGAHVEYFRGIANPIGIKVGPTMEAEEIVRILDIVNPDRVPGKVTLIGRYGAAKVDQFLPGHIDAVKKTDHPVVWQCDAMHGNTKSSVTDPALKTRHFVDVITEITRSMEIHKEKGTILGGVHLELTGELNEDGFSVTECIGGSMELEDKDLSFNYRTHCDPRLNYEQSLDIAFLLADYLKSKRRGEKPHDILLASLRGRKGEAKQ
ncbi:3-deoxy-7-phosphoheptulonate synthase [Cryptococcus wingfieldii CBS 7118]|uniref:Phospho-2-dehydro-3-deoxyheptonate aldolase n=1 Tax=Cryptococcus wingfieldii CBS 7118 TaxID=1295528 RepID=A0A1E3K300_9TREE|nr:3-deoxy-7-phosphoheptulonate synthase [Cryptococcus wingfieldii CBS 7118]ODO07323.1 3-deoxy-7-phosphoheptulonate synthase [Cryptococcus wingfieldii CBS 7118]